MGRLLVEIRSIVPGAAHVIGDQIRPLLAHAAVQCDGRALIEGARRHLELVKRRQTQIDITHARQVEPAHIGVFDAERGIGVETAFGAGDELAAIGGREVRVWAVERRRQGWQRRIQRSAEA